MAGEVLLHLSWLSLSSFRALAMPGMLSSAFSWSFSPTCMWSSVLLWLLGKSWSCWLGRPWQLVGVQPGGARSIGGTLLSKQERKPACWSSRAAVIGVYRLPQQPVEAQQAQRDGEQVRPCGWLVTCMPCGFAPLKTKCKLVPCSPGALEAPQVQPTAAQSVSCS